MAICFLRFRKLVVWICTISLICFRITCLRGLSLGVDLHTFFSKNHKFPHIFIWNCHLIQQSDYPYPLRLRLILCGNLFIIIMKGLGLRGLLQFGQDSSQPLALYFHVSHRRTTLSCLHTTAYVTYCNCHHIVSFTDCNENDISHLVH